MNLAKSDEFLLGWNAVNGDASCCCRPWCCCFYRCCCCWPCCCPYCYCTEYIAALLPFGPDEGYKWFFQIFSQWESQKNRFTFTSLVLTALRRYGMNGRFEMQGGKNWIFFRKRWTQTGSSGTLIGWKSGQTTFVPLWDRMEGAWLWALGYGLERSQMQGGKNFCQKR